MATLAAWSTKLILAALVAFIGVAAGKAAIMWIAWWRSDARRGRAPNPADDDPTDGAWFRLPPSIITVVPLLVGTVVGTACGALACCWTHTRCYPLMVAFGAPVAALVWARTFWVDTARRIATLLVPSPPLTPTPGPIGEGGKTIVVLCDGTGNRADAVDDTGRAAVTNVSKMHEALSDHVKSAWLQSKWYDAGVGTFTSRRSLWLARIGSVLGKIGATLPAEVSGFATRILNTFELATGLGIVENITQGYARIVELYEPGDRIAILGFSRGAYTARAIAGVIARCGLLRSEYVRFAPDVVRLYRYRSTPSAYVGIRSELRYSRTKVPIHFLGLWDTVASLGAPMWGWWFALASIWRQRAIDTDPAEICLNVHHALSIDERRAQFFPTLFREPQDGASQVRTRRTPNGFTQTIEQTWFRGVHADVGGGYAESALSDVALEWMAARAQQAGIAFDVTKFGADCLGDMHDEMVRVPGWNYLGSWPRWHPCPREDANVSEGFGYLDPSVYARAKHARARREARASLLGKPPAELALGEDELHFLEPGDTARIRVAANRPWNRTGLVLERGGRYRLRYVSGVWQDKECTPTGPAGQDASRHRDVRGRWGWARRLNGESAKWMTLAGTVAHPRDWPLQEKSARDLLYYLIRADPHELTDTLFSLGAVAARDVYLEVESPSGVLHCFANDLWAFYENNSGAVELDVTRLPNDASPTPAIVVTATGVVAERT